MTETFSGNAQINDNQVRNDERRWPHYVFWWHLVPSLYVCWMFRFYFSLSLSVIPTNLFQGFFLACFLFFLFTDPTFLFIKLWRNNNNYLFRQSSSLWNFYYSLVVQLLDWNWLVVLNWYIKKNVGFEIKIKINKNIEWTALFPPIYPFVFVFFFSPVCPPSDVHVPRQKLQVRHCTKQGYICHHWSKYTICSSSSNSSCWSRVSSWLLLTFQHKFERVSSYQSANNCLVISKKYK